MPLACLMGPTAHPPPFFDEQIIALCSDMFFQIFSWFSTFDVNNLGLGIFVLSWSFQNRRAERK